MLMALIVMVIWGFNFAVAKFGLREFSPIFLMCLRFAGRSGPAAAVRPGTIGGR